MKAAAAKIKLLHASFLMQALQGYHILDIWNQKLVVKGLDADAARIVATHGFVNVSGNILSLAPLRAHDQSAAHVFFWWKQEVHRREHHRLYDRRLSRTALAEQQNVKRAAVFFS